MNRKEAIKVIAELKLKELTTEERDSYLLCWWNIDDNDKEFEFLPEALKKELSKNQDYENPLFEKYNPLLLQAIIHEYKGVRNEYLESVLQEITNKKEKIKGEVEELEKCPCCGYRTLEKRKIYDICKVCYWEDGGTENLDIESSPNRMTLRQAKENFKKMGACEDVLVQYAEKEPDIKYLK